MPCGSTRRPMRSRCSGTPGTPRAWPAAGAAASRAPAAAGRGRLAVLAPAQLAGEHRDTVVLARLQEGAWPDLRLRSTLFGAAELQLRAGARRGAELPIEPEAVRALQR